MLFFNTICVLTGVLAIGYSLIYNSCIYLINITLFFFRYQREFGFTIPQRPIIVDDIRVRGVGKSAIEINQRISDATELPKAEKVYFLMSKFLMSFK